ncbi:hypothetical protein PAHAL_9G186500 [Panicum hallii]|uniref:Uncharacterized protein n=1 Tax=Panicum hallii TaxID=206008 RepID=A0A2T8I1N7_9POAL|nr:hypothetical protein PAHAL_9G186500 [Panicum hallii]
MVLEGTPPQGHGGYIDHSLVKRRAPSYQLLWKTPMRGGASLWHARKLQRKLGSAMRRHCWRQTCETHRSVGGGAGTRSRISVRESRRTGRSSSSVAGEACLRGLTTSLMVDDRLRICV